jgi:hypothetical protein
MYDCDIYLGLYISSTLTEAVDTEQTTTLLQEAALKPETTAPLQTEHLSPFRWIALGAVTGLLLVGLGTWIWGSNRVPNKTEAYNPMIMPAQLGGYEALQ